MTRAAEASAASRLPPPREVTASALVRGLASAQRLIGPASLLLAGAVLIEVGQRRGDPAEIAPLAGILVVMLLTSLALAWRPTVVLAVVQLLLGTVLGTVYAAIAILTLSAAESQSAYLVEAVATALIFVGAIRPRAADGIVWVAAAWLLGSASLALGAAVVGESYVLSWDRLTDAGIICGAYAVVAIGWRRRHERLPAMPELARTSLSGEEQRARERAATAIVHDTALAALTLVSRSEATPDDRLRRRIRRDLALVTTATVTPRGEALIADSHEGSLATGLLALFDELRWRGLQVDVAGVDTVADETGADATAALLAATAAALDNVITHSGTARADVTLGSSAGVVTVMIVDAGVGFDSESVSEDRLGLRESITGRIERFGGTARVWSSAAGTTVLLSVPAIENVDRTGESATGEEGA